LPPTARWSATSRLPCAAAVLALLGSSGSGKSLTCAAALGLLPPGVNQTAGRVLLDGMPVHGEQLRGATIATIMQNPRSAFNPLHTMAAHARETCRAAGREASDAACWRQWKRWVWIIRGRC
jgi:nickel transport system ATP-binding protein